MNAMANAKALRIILLRGTRGNSEGAAGGVTKESAVDKVAVHSAPTLVVALKPTGLQVTGVEIVVAPFLNCTVPVGP